MADRSVTAQETFADFRDTYIATCTDIGDITTLGNSFSGTPTDLVEACNKCAIKRINYRLVLCIRINYGRQNSTNNRHIRSVENNI